MQRRRKRRRVAQPTTKISHMNWMGVFNEVEINGSPTFVLTTSQIHSSNSSDEAAIDSGVEPLFLCPLRRFHSEQDRKENSERLRDGDRFVPFHDSPHFPYRAQQDEPLPDGSKWYEQSCKLPVIPLYWCNNKELEDEQICMCGNLTVGTDYYFCLGCDKRYHKECVESPLEIKHPFHPRHSLQLFMSTSDCNMCCDRCGIFLLLSCYRCTSCNFTLHPLCAMKPIPIVKNHPKRHPHPLTFFPRQDSLSCNVCGVIKKFPTYICVRCDFVVHRDCINFPYVIKISRHLHRVAFTSSLPSGGWSCGVCRRKIDNHYGAYTCQQCNNYFVHTRCALREDVWDGEELEGVPEELDVVVEPFETIADGIILHFTHGHHMRLEMSLTYDHTRVCQACVLPIYEGLFYACMDQCDFILHDSCANAPRRIQHALHPYPVTLKAVGSEHGSGQFHCSACSQRGCGFAYERFDGFILDVTCASVSEPFHYQGHEHLLFLALDPEEKPKCHVCKSEPKGNVLNCIECDFVLCFMCATLPYKVKCKHDKHYLTFRYWEEASDSDWCEICEGKLILEAQDLYYDGPYANEGTTWFYECTECCTTLHIRCLLGKHRYMKPGQTITVYRKTSMMFMGKKLICHILHNDSNSRPICSGRECSRRCPFNSVYKVDAEIFCSLDCATALRND